MNHVSDTIERHYWKAVVFLVVLILAGTGFWGLRRFAPAIFLGKPDLIVGPNEERPQSRVIPDKPILMRFLISTPPLPKNSKPFQISARERHKELSTIGRRTGTLPVWMPSRKSRGLVQRRWRN